ncbi:four-helix bundle copper-binding protein [Deinococcus multiflagellatus]|nr:four-helix bundle copper-binding protein [Deinococcus multiflagellatus]MBZ9715444.1 four-helix bundle copper-binding protein [Deinococcus multiflagellatus]
MDTLTRMLNTHPKASSMDAALLATCLQACLDCEAVCSLCADACLNESEHLHHLTRCITLNTQCAAVCQATAKVLASPGQGGAQVLQAQLEACLSACQACAAECEGHAQEMNMAHCAVCAESCRRCEQACQVLLKSVRA